MFTARNGQIASRSRQLGHISLDRGLFIVNGQSIPVICEVDNIEPLSQLTQRSPDSPKVSIENAHLCLGESSVHMTRRGTLGAVSGAYGVEGQLTLL